MSRIKVTKKCVCERERERETSEYLGVIAIVSIVDTWRGCGYGS